MSIDPAFIDGVLARTSLVDLIGRDVRLVRRGRDHWGLCPFHSEKTPSFSVNEGKGFYHCFGCGAHGDAIDWLQQTAGLGFRAAVDDLAVRAGLRADDQGRVRPKVRPVARSGGGDADREKLARIARARVLWAECRAAAGTDAEAYLRGRGIDVTGLGGMPPTLRYHPRLYHGGARRVYPAMVAAVQGADARITGVHRTYLAPGGTGKAPVPGAKRMAGLVWGGAIRLCPAAARLGLAEGIETALSVTVATGLPVWAAGSLGNMAAVELPPIVREVVLCLDGDGDRQACERQVAKALAFHGGRGLRVSVAQAPAGTDFNDLLLEGVA